MKKILTALLLLLLGGGGVVGIDKLGSVSNKFESPTHTIVYGHSAVSQIVAKNYNRQFLFSENMGTTTCSVWFNTSTDSITMNTGMTLYYASSTHTQKSYEINPDKMYFGPLQTICNGDSKISIIEK